MATPVEKIAMLEAEIEELKEKRNSTSNEELQISITNEITVIHKRIIQQGKIHKHLFSLSGSAPHQLIRHPILLQTLHTNHTPYRITIRNSYSVTAGGAGNGSVRIFLAVCAYSFFHDLGP